MKVAAMLLSNGSISIISMLLTLTISRQWGVSQLSVFAMSYAFLAITQILIRESCLNIALANSARSATQQAFDRSLIIAICGSAILLTAGTVVSSPIVMVMAWAVIAFCVFDFLRLWCAARHSTRDSIVADAVNAGIAASAIALSELELAELPLVLAIWCLGMTLASIYLAVRMSFRPFLNGPPTFPRAAVAFGLQGVLGSGSSQASNLIIGSLGSAIIVGTMRAASTLVGPMNLTTATLQSAAIRPIAESQNRRRTILRWLGVVAGIQAPVLIVTYFASIQWGSLLIGKETWELAAPLLPWVLLDAFFVGSAAVAHASHRADLKFRPVLIISTIAGIARLSLAPLAAFQWGAQGVAIVLSIISGAHAILTWVSYHIYRRHSHRT